MAISIIIPAYNAEKFLVDTLESVMAQTRDDWEVIVVNDGSTDQTGKIADTFGSKDKRIRVVHQENTGTARARNRGFAEARKDFEYCMLLDHDDLLEPDALEILIHTLEKNRDAVAAHGMRRHIDSEGKPLLSNGSDTWPGRRRTIQGNWPKVLPSSAPTTFAVLAYINCIPANSIMMRRAQKDIAGDFDPNIVGLDDRDMWLRLSRLGHIVFINRVIYAWRVHDRNTSRDGALMIKGDFNVRKKAYNSPDLNEEEKHLILLGHRYNQLYYARNMLISATRNVSKGRLIVAFEQMQSAMRYILSAVRGHLINS